MNNQTCCVIGFPIAHSLSPVIHSALYDIYDIDCTYTIREIKPGSLGRFINEISGSNIRGFNITMPYKNEIIPYLSENPHISSVNTVRVIDGRLLGISTDEAGFAKSLEESGFSYKNKNIVFIGAGAVTGTLATDATRKGAKKITLLNRTVEHAQAIASVIGGQAQTFDSQKTFESIGECDILINTTPLGMTGCPSFESLHFIKNLRQDALVCDLIYQPFTTGLLIQAAKQGNPTLGGISMLIWQAFYSFEYFFGITPTEQDKQTVLQIIEGRQIPDPLSEL